METVGIERALFARQNAPNYPIFKRLVEKFDRTGSITNEKSLGRRKSRRINKSIASVTETIGENPSISIRCCSQQLDISTRNHLYSYKDSRA